MRRISSLLAISITATIMALANPALATRAGSDSPDDPEGLDGGVLATFTVSGDVFKVWVTNPATIQQLFDLAEGNSRATIPNGRIQRGPGLSANNEPWSWHLDPQDVQMAEVTIEVCDATPSYVEKNLDYFVGTVGRYCPWSAVLVDLEDLRE